VPKLSINNYDFDKSVLHKEIAELKEKSEQQNKEKEKADEETKKELEQMRELQKQQAEQLAATSTRLEQMSQRYTKAFEIIPTLNYGDAHKFVSELLRGLPGQRAYEERQRKKKAENILYGD
jgi:Tfp pilus assembly protein FimV